jgi:hypothetical protein
LRDHDDKESQLRRAIAILILIATWTISPSLGETATIVAVWTRDEIALAADSGAEQLVVDQSPATICKVQKTGKVAYTMAGLYRDPVDSLDTFALARQVFSGPGLLSDQLNSFQHRVEDPLTKALARLKKEDSKTYDDFFARKSALSFFAASVVQRVPRLVGIDIGGVNETKRVSYTFPAAGTQPEMMMSAGETDALNQLYLNPPPWLKPHPRSPVALVTFLVLWQSLETPNRTSLPIDVIRVNKTGVHWVQRKKECEEGKR